MHVKKKSMNLKGQHHFIAVKWCCPRIFVVIESRGGYNIEI